MGLQDIADRHIGDLVLERDIDQHAYDRTGNQAAQIGVATRRHPLSSEGFPRRLTFFTLRHYHAERNHQGRNNELIEPVDEVGAVAGRLECRERLGGMLRYYYRDAA